MTDPGAVDLLIPVLCFCWFGGMAAVILIVQWNMQQVDKENDRVFRSMVHDYLDEDYL